MVLGMVIVEENLSLGYRSRGDSGDKTQISGQEEKSLQIEYKLRPVQTQNGKL